MEILAGLGWSIHLSGSSSDEREALQQRGRDLIAAGDAEGAIEALQQACQELLYDAGALRALAQAQSQAKRWEEAMGTLARLVALEPFAARGHHNLGVALFHLGHKDYAVDQWGQALLLDETLAGAREALSRVGATEAPPSLLTCIAHPSRECMARCQACGVPLCSDCSLTSPQGPHCERHVPAVPEENRQRAQELLERARASFVALRRELQPEGAGAAGAAPMEGVFDGGALTFLAFGLAGVAAVHVARAADGAMAEQRFKGLLAPTARLLQEAIRYDPSLEEAALRLVELGELCDAAGRREAVPVPVREWAIATCSGYSPQALGVRFLAQSRVDCREALWQYFSRLTKSESVPWEAMTLRVIATASGQGYGPEVLPYLRALMARLPRGSSERRQCRAQVRFLEERQARPVGGGAA